MWRKRESSAANEKDFSLTLEMTIRNHLMSSSLPVFQSSSLLVF